MNCFVFKLDCVCVFVCFSSAMRTLVGKAGLFGTMSVAFGSMFWSQQKTESEPVASNPPSSDSEPGSTYELKLVQVLFRHGARTPLKSIPDVMEVKLHILFLLSSLRPSVS